MPIARTNSSTERVETPWMLSVVRVLETTG
jgi:hypothetical protein